MVGSRERWLSSCGIKYAVCRSTSRTLAHCWLIKARFEDYSLESFINSHQVNVLFAGLLIVVFCLSHPCIGFVQFYRWPAWWMPADLFVLGFLSVKDKACMTANHRLASCDAVLLLRAPFFLSWLMAYLKQINVGKSLELVPLDRIQNKFLVFPSYRESL